MYTEEEVLFEQIDKLSEKAGIYRYDADLQLLLGYQLLGAGAIDDAFEPLQQASLDSVNADAATVLLDLLAKIKTENGDTNME